MVFSAAKAKEVVAKSKQKSVLRIIIIDTFKIKNNQGKDLKTAQLACQTK
jgi:hypothetical protein